MFEARLAVADSIKEVKMFENIIDAFGFAVLHLCEYGEMKPSEAKAILEPVLMIACEQIQEKDSEIAVWEVEEKGGIAKCVIKNMDGGGLPELVEETDIEDSAASAASANPIE